MEPLKSLDELDAFDGTVESTVMSPKRCSHKMKLVSGTEMRCTKCSAGWTGPGVKDIYDAWLKK